jgi:hypothetical protein
MAVRDGSPDRLRAAKQAIDTLGKQISGSRVALSFEHRERDAGVSDSVDAQHTPPDRYVAAVRNGEREQARKHSAKALKAASRECTGRPWRPYPSDANSRVLRLRGVPRLRLPWSSVRISS